MNLKIVDSGKKLNETLTVKDFELELVQKSLEYERKLVQEKLEGIASQFPAESMEFDGIKCKRKVRTTKVSIGRVSVNWSRPIYEGSKNGRTVRFYPADEAINQPKKTKGSYQILANSALLGAFLPFNLGSKILGLLMGVKLNGSTVKRYTESVGQFGAENIDEILKLKSSEITLEKDEILIASIDGSSSLINGTRLQSNKKKIRKGKKKDKKNKIKPKYSKDDYLKEAKVFRLSVYNTDSNKIVRTILVYAIIRRKDEVLEKLKKLISILKIPQSTTLYTTGDGAKWVKDVLDSLHSNSQFLLDFYHAASYVTKVGLLKYFTKEKLGSKRRKKYLSKLKKHGGQSIFNDLKSLKNQINASLLSLEEKNHDIKMIDEILGYLEDRVDQMDYKTAREESRPIGSGFIESACKQIVKQRLGLSGGRFYLEAADRIMQLRCIIMMDAWDILVDLMYKKHFKISHCRPSSSYELTIRKAA